jgi:hypothetical protein
MTLFGKSSINRPGALALAVSVVVLASCGDGPEEEEITPVIKPIKLTETNPGAEPQCQCENSTGVYIENISDKTRRATWRINTRDTLSGEILDTISGEGILNAGQKEFIGCTIHAPETSCRFQARYRLGQVYTTRSATGAQAAIFGSVMTPSISSCVAWCSGTGNANDPFAGHCLPLGSRYYKGIAPIREMVVASQAGDGIVAKEDVLDRYGLTPADDKCDRGDIVTDNGRIINEGQLDYCDIESASLPERVLSALGMDGLLDDPLKMVSTLPRRLEAVPMTSMSLANGSASDVAVFDSSETAPFIRFEGADGENLTELFGGDILATARIEVPNRPKQTIVATTNGCIAIDEP